MKKVILRLTESDIHNMIRSTVNRMLKEDVLSQGVGEFDYKSDILKGRIDGGHISANDNEVEFEVIGKSGAEYSIYATVSCDVQRGMRSMDYDVPDDPDECSAKIISLEIAKYDEETNDWTPIPYKRDPRFERALEQYLDVDFNDYEDWGTEDNMY